MNGALTAANKNCRSLGRNFSNFYRLAGSFYRISQEIYSQQAFYVYYTSLQLVINCYIADRESKQEQDED